MFAKLLAHMAALPRISYLFGLCDDDQVLGAIATHNLHQQHRYADSHGGRVQTMCGSYDISTVLSDRFTNLGDSGRLD